MPPRRRSRSVSRQRDSDSDEENLVGKSLNQVGAGVGKAAQLGTSFLTELRDFAFHGNVFGELQFKKKAWIFF